MKRANKKHKIQALFHDPRTTIRDLAKAIKKDQVLAERLIRLIKSYGFPPEAWNVKSAIILLGFDAIKTILTEQMALYQTHQTH